MLFLRFTPIEPALYAVYASKIKLANVHINPSGPHTVTPAGRRLTKQERQSIVAFAEMGC